MNKFSNNGKHWRIQKLLAVLLLAVAVASLVYSLLDLDYFQKNLKQYNLKYSKVVIESLNKWFSIISNATNALGTIEPTEYFSSFIKLYNDTATFISSIFKTISVPYLSYIALQFSHLWSSILTNLYIDFKKIPLWFIGTVLQLALFIFNHLNYFKTNLFSLFMWFMLIVSHYYSYHFDQLFLKILRIVATILILLSVRQLLYSKKVSFKEKSIKNYPNISNSEKSLDLSNKYNSLYASPLKLKRNNYKQEKVKNIVCNINPCSSSYDNLSQSYVSYANDFSSKYKDNVDLNVGLNNLHLGKPFSKKKIFSNNTFELNKTINRPRPVISPAKFQHITQNSWVAGGFWKNSNGVLMPINNLTNLSRSSSQTSGFLSHYNSSPSSVNESIYEDLEYNSNCSGSLHD